jgi:hypothetical protein
MAAWVVVVLAGGCAEPLRESLFGAYRLSDGRLVSVRESTPETLRLRVYDSGETRRYSRADDGTWLAGEGLGSDALTGSTLSLDGDTLRLAYPDGAAVTGERVAFATRVQHVEVNGARLYLRLTLPSGDGPHPAVVIAHGSGDDAATRSYGTPDFFPAHGIASVVYDKRGTGRSSGTYTMDFHQLADDLVGITAWLADQPEVDPARIGVTGYSQGSWIGPLAAARSRQLSFVIANYGMIDSPRAEARGETEERFRKLGFDQQAVHEVGELADASIDTMASDYEDWSRFDALVGQYRDRPWMQQLDYPLADFQRWPHWLVRLVAPYVSVPGLRWDYTSMAALDELAARGIPSVWLVASHDTSAPNAFTLAELERRWQAGEPVEVRVLSPTDHGFVLFEERRDGTRRYGNHHPDYFEAEVAYLRRLAGLRPATSPDPAQ